MTRTAIQKKRGVRNFPKAVSGKELVGTALVSGLKGLLSIAIMQTTRRLSDEVAETKQTMLKPKGVTFLSRTVFIMMVFYTSSSFFGGCTQHHNVTPDVIRFADPHLIGGSLVYLAENQGYFSDEGLRLDSKKFDWGKDALLEVLENRADIAFAYTTPIVMEALHQQPACILASLHRSTHSMALVGRHDRGIQTLSDLKGKRIGYMAGTNLEYFVITLLDAVGLDTTEVSLIDVPREDMKVFIQQGKIDAGVLFDIELIALQSELPHQSYAIFYGHSYAETSFLVSNEQFVKSHPDTIKKVLKALVKAEALANDDKKKITLAIARRFPHAIGAYIIEALGTMELIVRLDNVGLNSMNDQAQFLRQTLKTKNKPEFYAMFRGSFLESINPLYVTYLKD